MNDNIIPVDSNHNTLRAGLSDRLLNACDLFAIDVSSYSEKNHVVYTNTNFISHNAAG